MTTPYIPQHLASWTLPDSYAGAHWPDHYVFLAQNRDSDCLTRANFDAGLKAIGGEQTVEPQTDNDDSGLAVTVVRESHWAVGWVEWIAIHKDATAALMEADRIAGKLEDYPVVCEHTWSEYETAEADQVWKNCYDWRERIDYIRQHRSQFDFHGFADLLGCVRGKYFSGYANELIG